MLQQVLTNEPKQLTVVANNLTTSNLTKEDKEVGKVYETYDYQKFSFFSENREINPANIKKLKKSLLRTGQLQNIIVDKTFKIADGQHRFEILKGLKWPVRYEVRSDVDIKKIQEMQLGRAWDVKDFVVSYTHGEDEKQSIPYKLYNSFITDYKLGHNMTLALICGTYSNNVPTEEFKDGSLKVTQEQYEQARKEARMITGFAKYHKKYKKRSFVLAILTLLKKVKGYNHSMMIDKISKHSGDLLEHNKTSHYVQNLISIYNKYTPKNKQLNFNQDDVIAGND